ncbi:MAG: DUF697 domain-containing protein [Gemmataceae bacterium]
MPARQPPPIVWLFGKTQSGKTSVIKYLTGATDAEVGEGFRPCTRTTRRFAFPDDDAPLVTFLDTRGLDEPGYDATDDLSRFDSETHLVLVTVKLLDHALENVVAQLRKLRSARQSRPVILVVTCLHEAYPQQQHPPELPPDAERSLAEHRRRFEGLYDACVPVDLTRPDEGFTEVNFGGEALKSAVVNELPRAYRQAFRALAQPEDGEDRKSRPVILGYAAAAAAAGAVPIPWLDLLVLPGLQSQMVAHLAKRFGRPLEARRFAEVASALGLGLVARQAVRELAKFIPYVGSVASAALAAASTYALGEAYCHYDRAIAEGRTPAADELRAVYAEQLAKAQELWKGK